MTVLSKRSYLEGEYKIDHVFGEWAKPGGRELCVRWQGYNFLGDTWEDEKDVAPASKVAKFDEGISFTGDLRWALGALRRALKDRMTSRKIKERGPAHKALVRIPALDHPDMSRALVEYVSRMHRPHVKVKETGPGECRVTVYDLDHIADIVALHLTEANVGLGNLRVNCGAASYEDMMMVIPPLTLIGATSGFRVELSTAVFHGKTGLPRFPKILDEDEQLDTAEQTVLVDHAKLILKQTWATYPLKHELKRKGWQNLPAHKWKL